MECIRKATNERNLNEGQWEDRKQWSLGVGQRRKTFWNWYVYRYTANTLLSSASSRLLYITERISFLQIPLLSSHALAEGLLLIVTRGGIPSHTVQTRFVLYQLHDLTTPRTKKKAEASKFHVNTWLLQQNVCQMSGTDTVSKNMR